MDVETDTSSAEEIDVEPSDFPDREPSPDFPEPADLLPEEPSVVPSTDRALPATAPEPYARAAAHLPNVLRQLERVKSTIESSSWTPAHLFDLAQDLLFPALALLVDLGDLNTEDGQAQFTSEFCLGPFGLAPFIDLLHRFYVLTINWKARLPHVEIQGFVSVLNSFSTPIYAALLHFRSTIPRTSYDSAGFSTLREVLQKHGYKFGEADASDRLLVLDYSHLNILSRLSRCPDFMCTCLHSSFSPTPPSSSHTQGNGLSAIWPTMSVPSPSHPDKTIFHALGFVLCFAPNFSTIFVRRSGLNSGAACFLSTHHRPGTASSSKDDPDGGSGYKTRSKSSQYQPNP
ncbi:hypothetical protein B0H13DRAFT_2261846 [Mycena leptocephala]|nr:hypothetical protein B0H13DRAFT_2261846 [Mycena leptocephala]